MRSEILHRLFKIQRASQSKNGINGGKIAKLFPVSFFLFMGCQLLGPYEAPLTPTPSAWKGSFEAKDVGQPALPSGWKERSLEQPSPLPVEDPYSDRQSTDESSLSPLEEDSQMRAPGDIAIEDLRRDLGNWWEVFHDAKLNELEEQALSSSYTLTAALERVLQARTQAAMSYSPLLPSVLFSPSFSRTGSLFQNPFFVGSGSDGNGKLPKSPAEIAALLKNAKMNQANASSSAVASTADFRFIQSQYLFPFSINYEVDLWNQLHNAFYASVHQAQASYEDYLGVLLSLTADVASTYFQARGLDARQEVIQQNIEIRQEAVNVNRARYQAGIIVYLDVSKAIVELARARSEAEDVRRSRGLQENQLATLIGVPASVFSLPYNPISVAPPVIPQGLPSELLTRRPDIASAERKIAAAWRQMGVAWANFFPSFNLNTAIGFESPFAYQLFNWRSRLWQVGWQCAQTLFDGGRNAANYEYYESIYKEALAHYQQTTLQAFQDVEDALVNLRGFAAQAHDLSIAVKYARLALELAQMRYTKGLTNYLDVVDAERQVLEAEQAAVVVLSERYLSTIMLIRALGGGWSCE